MSGAATRRTALALALALSVQAAPCAAWADGADAATVQVPIDAARTPGSPAFSLLGIEPATIDRPTTPKAFALSLLSAVGEGDPLPRNYAVEVSPFWIAPQPTVEFDDRYGGSLWMMIQTLSISLATSTAEEDGSPTSVGLGLRTQLVGGRARGSLKEAKRALEKAQAERASIPDGDGSTEQPIEVQERDKQIKALGEELSKLAPRRKALLERLATLRVNPPAEPDMAAEERDSLAHEAILVDLEAGDLSRRIDELEAKQRRFTEALPGRVKTAEQKINAARDDLKKLVTPVGFTLEAAGGATVDFAGGELDAAAVGRWGAWLIPSYRCEDIPFSFLMIGRYLRDERAETSAVDVGGRVVVQSSDDLAVSLEYAQRFEITGDDPGRTYRAAGILEYRIADTSYLTATVGKDFDAGDGDGDILSLIGLRVDIGSTPKVLVPLDLKE